MLFAENLAACALMFAGLLLAAGSVLVQMVSAVSFPTARLDDLALRINEWLCLVALALIAFVIRALIS